MQPADDGLPKVGPSARALGVRVPHDLVPDSEGRVHPSTGGMSVSPETPWNVPNHRRSRGMGRGSSGPADDVVYRIQASLLGSGLSVRRDPRRPDKHAFVEPAAERPLAIFESDLAATRPDWTREWP